MQRAADLVRRTWNTIRLPTGPSEAFKRHEQAVRDMEASVRRVERSSSRLERTMDLTGGVVALVRDWRGPHGGD